MTILLAILILGIIILIHELGHFTTAKIFKMPVSEFSIGMGPSVYSYLGPKTTYSFRAIPIGGYVNIEGMEIDSKIKNGFNSKPAWQRLIVLGAGIFNNFLLAYILIFLLLMIGGKYVQNPEPIVGSILETSYANGKILPKDKILEIENTKIEKWEDIGKIVGKKSNDEKKELVVSLERDNKKMEINVPLTREPEGERFYLGIVPEFRKENYSIGEAFINAGISFKNMIAETYRGLKMLILGKVKAKEISGPVGIVKVVGEVSKEGIVLLVWLTALLSINIGFFNLLPFPALDGGRIVFTILEMLGVNVNKKWEEKLHYFGMVILFGMIILVTANDFFNLL
jgi:regulator of sigma E protease